jgi:purine nucleoside permease
VGRAKLENIELVGSRVVDYIVANWAQWHDGVPAR